MKRFSFVNQMSRQTSTLCLALVVAFAVQRVDAVLPPDLPGEEITQERLNIAIAQDSASSSIVVNPEGTGIKWLDRSQKTWEAPPLAEQMSSVTASLGMGAGGLFIPRFTSASNEPAIEIESETGKKILSGTTGSLYSLEPGNYSVRVGSGSRNQRLVKKIAIVEGKTEPLIPDWCGLTIETVDSTGLPFRGEYELVRMDEFDAYGRGYGANFERGEVVKTWILTPGIYKIFSIGQSYNAITNYITVRLVRGELTRLAVIENGYDMKIVGGGIIDVAPQSNISSHWKYGADVGGNLNFFRKINRLNTADTIGAQSTLFSLMSTLWLNYRNNPFDWQTRIRLDESFSLKTQTITSIVTENDGAQLYSLYIWRILPRIGPYAQAQLNTTLLSRNLQHDVGRPFCVVRADSTIEYFDSTSSSFRLRPPFSPLRIDLGMGANADLFNYSFFDFKARLGFGSTYTYVPKQYVQVDPSIVQWHSGSSAEGLRDSLFYADSTTTFRNSYPLLTSSQTSLLEPGPQASFSCMIRLGRVITANAELQILAPIERFMLPDFDLRTDISWQLTRWMNIDYTYTYVLDQPKNTKARIDLSTHGIWLRFSYSGR